MSTLTIRNLDPALAVRLKERSAAHGRSMEAEVREILARELKAPDEDAYGLASRIRARFAGYEFEIPERSKEMPREIDFGE